MEHQMLKEIESHFNDRAIVETDFVYLPPDEEAHLEPVYMGSGRPNVSMFPIKQIDLHIRSSPCSQETSKAVIPESSLTEYTTVENYLQYGPPAGHEPVVQLAKHLITSLQNPPYDLDYLVTTGSGDSLTKLLSIFTSPGDTILVENYSYTPIFGPMETLGVRKIPFPVVMASNGPVIDIPSLAEILDTWGKGVYRDLKMPKVIYTVPTQNPLGLTQPVSTMNALYKICQKYDIIILEDDPDGYISFKHLESFENYKASLMRSSYLSLDIDGRVFRMETFSKLFCPGIRLGFIAGRTEAMAKLLDYSKVFTKTASGISQAVLMKTVDFFNDGGNDGYLKWCYEVSKEYKRRKDTWFRTIANLKSVQLGLLTPVEPDGGMFFVCKIPFVQDSAHSIQVEMEKFYYKCLKAGVIVILGREMTWDSGLKDQATFIRLTVTNLANLKACEEGALRLNQAVLEYFDADSS